MEALLEAEAAVNAQDRSGWTPLHWAAFKGRVTVGGHTTITRTVLVISGQQRALKRERPHPVQAAAALLAAGADEALLDRAGQSWRRVGAETLPLPHTNPDQSGR